MANAVMMAIALSFWWLSFKGKPTLLDWPLRAIAILLLLSTFGSYFS